MMDSDIVQSVRQLFLENKNVFIIPCYQRGYKWTEGNVTYLLNSIAQKIEECRGTEQYFCLQNITLRRTDDGLRVIDGQQRLITLLLILSHLDADIKSKIRFLVRNDTERFINEIITEKHVGDADSLDEEYICEAVDAISKWFETNTFDTDIFLDKVKLIVNVVETECIEDEEQTFANLNGIKSELDGSDLLRAIFITHCETETEDEHKLGEFFDELNAWCNDAETNKFIERLTEINNIKVTKSENLSSYHARIEFTDKLYPINLLYKLLFVIKRKDEATEFNYIYFENLLSSLNCRNVFDELKELYGNLKRILKDRELYHFLGFLIFNYNNIDFKDLYSSLKQGDDVFLRKVKGMICSKIEGDFGEDFSISDIGDPCFDWYGDSFADDGRKKALTHILILQDVLLFTRHPEVGFMPVQGFTKANDDIEHIACQTPNDKDCNDRERWEAYLTGMKELADANDDDKVRRDIKKLENASSSEEAMAIINAYGLNSAGNLVLLDSGINRGYRNSVYENKQNKVIEAYFKKTKRRYIRPYTLKVFLSNWKNEGVARWSFKDIKGNTKTLYETTVNWLRDNEQRI